MNFIKKLIESKYITPSQGRAMEIFIYWTILSFLIWLMEWLNTIITGWEFEFMLFLTAFGSTTLLAISSAVAKHLRDLKEDLLSNK